MLIDASVYLVLVNISSEAIFIIVFYLAFLCLIQSCNPSYKIALCIAKRLGGLVQITFIIMAEIQ